MRSSIVTLMTAATLVASPILSALPDTPHGRGAQAFLDLIAEAPDGGYTEAHVRAVFTQRLIEKHGVERLADILDGLHQDFVQDVTKDGYAFEIEDLSKDGDSLTMTVAGAHGPVALTLDLDPDHEFKVDGIVADASDGGMQGGPPIPDAPPSGWQDAAEGFLEGLVEAGFFSGTAMVAAVGEAVAEPEAQVAVAYGEADRETDRSNTLDTPFNLGSMNKMFTGLAIAQLVEAGELAFDDTVAEHLPDFPAEGPVAPAREATIHQLLTHQSGLGSYWNEAYMARKGEIDTLGELFEVAKTSEMVGPPGEQYEYSNTGPVVLGMIIEAVTGRSYYDYVRENVFEPAGMERTGYYRRDGSGIQPTPAIATGYHRERPDQERWPNTDWLGMRGGPAGGGYSTARDMMRFADAVLDGELVSREMLETVWAPHVQEGPDFAYGYLWGRHVADGTYSVGHNGGAPGVSADFKLYPERGYAVVVLSNYSRAAGPISDWLNRMVVANTE